MHHAIARAGRAAACALLLCLGAGVSRSEEPQPPKPSEAAIGMLDAMREKGIITEAEYEDLYKRQALYELKQKEEEALPSWLKDWTFGGDLGVRFDQINRGGTIDVNKALNSGEDPVDIVNGTASAKRNRFRLRVRLGAERTIGDDFLIGFRIATSQASTFGGDAGNSRGDDFTRTFASDPRSAWVTLGSYFAPKGVFIDRAYIKWAPHLVDGLVLELGKMPNFFTSSEFSGDIMVWDPDISPEGAQVQYGFRLFDEHAWVNLRGSYFTVDEVPSASLKLLNVDGQPTAFPDIDEKDPFMYGFQLDMGGDILPWLRAGARVSYYNMRDINARTAAAMEDLGNGGAAITDNPLFLYAPGTGFQTNGASRGMVREIVYDAFVKMTPYEGWTITPWFQLTHMFDAGSEDYGYDTGFDLVAPTNTKLTFMYASMPRNGTIALFTDSDFFDGFVNARGWGVTLAQAFNRWTTLRASYLWSEERSSDCKAFGDTGQALLCDTSIWENAALAQFRRQQLDRDRILVDLLVKF